MYALRAEDVAIFLLFPPMRSPAALLIVCLFGLLFVTACGGNERTPVYDAKGKQIGAIEIQDTSVATIFDAAGAEAGAVRGTVVRNTKGGKAGSIQSKDGHVVLTDGKGQDIGSIENGTDCYGKSQAKLGSVQVENDVNIAGAACLLLLLPR